MQYIVLCLILAVAAVSPAQLVKNGYTSTGLNDLNLDDADRGWVAKAKWTGISGGVEHTGGDNWSVGQVNSIGSEAGNELIFSFDWTPAATAGNGSLELVYQLIGWNEVGMPTSGVMFGGINYDGKYVGTADGMLEKVDLVSGTSGGTSGGNFATGYSVIGQAGQTEHVELVLNLADDASGIRDIGDYEYIGFRFFINSNDDGNNTGATIEHVSLTTEQGVELVSANLKEDIRSGEADKLAPWSFKWNPTGIMLGNESGYADLVSGSGGVYRDTGSPVGADYTNSRGAGIGNDLSIYDDESQEKWWLISGADAANSTDGADHALIIGYTVPSDQTGRYRIKASGGNSASAELQVYVNDILLDTKTYASGITGSMSVNTAELSEGDTIYLAFISDSSADRNTRRWYGNVEVDQIGDMESFETGYTITKIRTGADGGGSFIVGSSSEGTVLRVDYEGAKIWTNALSGIMNHDIWCDDLNGDGTDDVLAANADGSIYCLNGQTGTLLWQFKTNNAPMHAVCTIRDSNDVSYVVCGGFDKNIYYLTTNGSHVMTLPSSTYSIADSWVDKTPTCDNIHVANFLRPRSMPDGQERLLVLGASSHVWASTTQLYEFLPLGTQPVETISFSNLMGYPGALRVVDPGGDGHHDLLIGMGGGQNDAGFYRFDFSTPTSNAFTRFDVPDALAANGLGNDFGYRTVQVETFGSGAAQQVLALYGNRIVISPSNLNESQSEVLECGYAFNDMWKDPITGNILLASAQSGGSSIHLIDFNNPGWKSGFEALEPPGKIQAMHANMAAVHSNLSFFVKPLWERDPLEIGLCGFYEGALGGLINSIKSGPTSLKFLGGHWFDREITDWRYEPETYLDNDEYRERRDGRMNYVLTQQEAVDTISSYYAGNDGISYWGGHGNDPYMYQRSTTEQIILAGAGKPAVIIWPEIYGSDSDFEWVLNDLFYPLGNFAATNNAKIYFRSKAPMWFSVIHTPIWDGFRSGAYAGAFVAAQEETGAKIADLSIAGRLGVWASGVVDQWGSRAVPDMVRFHGMRTHCDQRVPSHYLRYTIYNMALGARYINDHGVYWHEDYFELLYQLIDSGALFVPERDEIVSFSPVHLGMKNPDPALIQEVNGLKWNIFYDESWEENNPRVFSRINDSWPGAPVTGWDFSRYAAGVKDRTTHFLPNYENGMVMITPPQDGTFVQPDAVRGRLDEKLHPLYRNIMQEFITDGTDYISADGSMVYPADTYAATVSNAIAEAAQMLPVTVKGDVAWVCAQTDPYHLRLTLIDGGFLNPSDRMAEVTFNTVHPVNVSDIMDGTVFSVAGTQSMIDVPLGTFRFIDIELAEPFFPDNGWGEFASGHGLTGSALADHDNDGEPDLLEYALNGNPTNASVQGRPVTVEYGPDDAVRFSFPQLHRPDSGILYLPEWSTNLVSGTWNRNWTGSDVHPGTDPDYDEAEYRMNGEDYEHFFMRLKTTVP